jgi:hypothetical protein
MNDKRADDLNEGSSLPQPGTKEPKDHERSDSTEGPGNVSVDEPTQPILNPEKELFEEDEEN